MEIEIDFITKKNEKPFAGKTLQPIHLQDTDPANKQEPSYIVNYLFAIKEKITRFPEDFNILAKIGQGSFGDVYLVKYRRDQKIYALKILRNLEESEVLALQNFDDSNYGSNNNVVREILLLKDLRDVFKLQHPNIVELKDFWI